MLNGSASLRVGMASAYMSAHPGNPKCRQKSNSHWLQPTSAEAQPAELTEWDYERNDAEGIYPENITLGSGKQVH